MTTPPLPGDPAQFPNRPKHKDFARLSDAVFELDGLGQRNPRYVTGQEVAGRPVKFNPFLGLVDPDSVHYMAVQRVALALKHWSEGKLATDDPTQIMQSIWMEAFACGVKFQQLGGHQ